MVKGKSRSLRPAVLIFNARARGAILPAAGTRPSSGKSRLNSTTARQTPCRSILVINAKGGCGKTTVATNLCAAYAAQGRTVALLDNDGQGAGAYWLRQRPGDAFEVTLGAPAEGRRTERIIIDGPGEEDNALLAWADLILTPILPSAMDVRAGGNFITSLMTKPRFRASPKPIGAVANRVQPNTGAQARLLHLLGCLNVPVAATLRDSPVYGEAMECGAGVADLIESRAARKEMVAWRTLLAWIEAQLRTSAQRPQPLRAGRPSRARPARRRAASACSPATAAGGESPLHAG